MPRYYYRGPIPLQLACEHERQYTDSQQSLAAKGLVLLSQHCDGAREVDFLGFNRKHAESDWLQTLVRVAETTGEVPLNDMPAVMRVLRVYSQTQLQALADELWSGPSRVTADPAAAFMGVLRDCLKPAGSGRRPVPIGWHEQSSGDIYLKRGLTFAAVKEVLDATGVQLDGGVDQLERELLEEGWLGCTAAESRWAPSGMRPKPMFRFRPETVGWVERPVAAECRDA